jgi:hypothetical protein
MAVVKKIKTVFQFRRGTTAEWELNKDIVPAAGEPCYDLDLGSLKIGDGKTTYANLKFIGGATFDIAPDGKSIVLEDSILKLAGFNAAEVGAQPRKNADGNIEWVVPSTETVDGLQATIADMRSDIEAIQDVLEPAEDGGQGIVSRVETLEIKMDGTGEGSVDKKIDAKINEFATRISGDGTINTFKELVDYVATHGNDVADMVADILDLQGKVGTTPVSEQIDAAVADKVTAEDGKSLIYDTLIEKLQSIEEDAQANKIESISVANNVLEADNRSVNIPMATNDGYGVVKGSSEITISEDGALQVGSIHINKIVQDDTTTLIMDGGNAGV